MNTKVEEEKQINEYACIQISKARENTFHGEHLFSSGINYFSDLHNEVTVHNRESRKIFLISVSLILSLLAITCNWILSVLDIPAD